MTHDELREVVARAICKADGFNPDRMMFGNTPRWQFELDRVDAAIAAVRAALGEPDEAMLEEGETALACSGVDNPNEDDAAECYRAMLAASPLADPAARDDGMEGA